MILVDTSVWIDHLKNGLNRLIKELNEGGVLCHPFVIGELACGNLENRNEILRLFKALPEVQVANHSDVLALVESNRLFSRGLGWIDMHLLTSAMMTQCGLWTKDKRLHSVANELEISV